MNVSHKTNVCLQFHVEVGAVCTHAAVAYFLFGEFWMETSERDFLKIKVFLHA